MAIRCTVNGLSRLPICVAGHPAIVSTYVINEP